MFKLNKDCNLLYKNFVCPFLNVTENNQKDNHVDHRCNYLKQRIYHRGQHPILPPLSGCPFFQGETTMEGD